jgi:glycosyltransferase involved in cell wall biosynthesis
MVGTDILERVGGQMPVDLFGMSSGAVRDVRPQGDIPQTAMHRELARRRAYLHPTRWTSLGLALLEAMHLGMPVVGVAATEAARAVPPEAGLLTNDFDELIAGLRYYLGDPEAARAAGKAARAFALDRYGLERFLGAWDRLLEEVTR